MTYRLTRRARQDVLAIWRYIANNDESAADRFIDLLTHYFRLLGDNPHAGRPRDMPVALAMNYGPAPEAFLLANI